MSKEAEALKSAAKRCEVDLAAANEALATARERARTVRADLAKAKESYAASGTDEAWNDVERATRAVERAEADVARTTAIASARAAEGALAQRQAAEAVLADLVSEIEPFLTVEEGEELVRAALVKLRHFEALDARAARNDARRQAIAEHCNANGLARPPSSAIGASYTPNDLVQLVQNLLPQIERATLAAALENCTATPLQAAVMHVVCGMSPVDPIHYAFARSRLPKDVANLRATHAGKVVRMPPVDPPKAKESILGKVRAMLADTGEGNLVEAKQ
jgi:hypothetical protein